LINSLVPRLAAICVCLAGCLVQGEPNTGQVTGTVYRGSSKAVIAGATIEARELSTNVTSAAKASAAGKYSILSLRAGVYELTGAAQGFATFKQKLFVSAGAKINADITLDPSGTQSRMK
jgi:hypothetical protein